ncbi:MAG: DUF167 domain-containing protein [Candidatus Ancaeobacter aquaticus]|nr:DUF167 domain-containing protein [Candidatus Ancaeobacter aquaticus]
MTKIDVTETKAGLILKVKVQPKANHDQVIGMYDGGIKIKIQSPPVDGKANKACESFLSKLLGIPKGGVSLVKGLTSKNKMFRISGLDKNELVAILEKYV